MQTESSIVIKGGLEEVFSVVWNVERYPEFIPEFEQTKILEQDNERVVMERRIKLGWFYPMWRSEMKAEGKKLIKFVHLSGILKEMETVWRFRETEGCVEIRTFHNFEVKIPILGRMITFIIWNAFVKRTAETMLKRMKKRVEGMK